MLYVSDRKVRATRTHLKQRLYERESAVLLDADGKVGKLYGAKVTPTMVVISPKGEVVYKGAIDSIRSADPEDIEFAENFVAQVLDAVLDGKEPPITETKAYG